MSCYDLSEKIKLFAAVVVVVQPSRLFIHCSIPYIIHHMVFYIISKKTSNYDQEIQSHTVNQPTAL